MTEDELMVYSEPAIKWAYGKHFARQYNHYSDDLMQEARLAILEYYRKTPLKDEVFLKHLPTYAVQGMSRYMRKGWRRENNGYREGPIDASAYCLPCIDYSVRERLLFLDIEKVSNDPVYLNPNKIRSVMLLLYQGFGIPETSRIKGVHKEVIRTSAKRFGRRLLSAWASC